MAYADSVLIFFAGSCAGSFLNVCIYRLPRGIGLLAPRRSFCPACRVSIRWPDNIPLFSYLCLGGRCRDCRSAISPVYPLIEIVSGALALLCLARGVGGAAFIYLLFFYALLVISAIDLAHRIIPNRILLLLLLLGVAGAQQLEMPPGGIALPGLLVGALLLLLVRWLGGIIFRREALGMGDVKLGAVVGFFLGWQSFLLALFLGALLGLLSVAFLTCRQSREMPDTIPFAPFLSSGCLLAWCGESVFSFQLSVISSQLSVLEWIAPLNAHLPFTINQ